MAGLIAAGIGAAGAIGSALAPKLFGGSSNAATTGATSGNTSQQSGPALGTPYLNFENQQLANISGLSTQAPFNYNINSMFAPFNGQQNQAFAGVNNAANSWQNNFGLAGNYLGANSNPMYNPTSTAGGAFGNAQGTPSALSQANPWIGQAGQSAPSTLNSYLSPNINNVIGASDQLQTSNFTNNVLPSLTAGFVGSGGGLGSKAYGNATNMALTNLNQNIGNTNAGALQNAFNASTTAAQNDLSRYAGLAGTAGNLALGQQQGYSNLGTAVGNNAALGNQTNLANASANQALGTGYLNNGLTGANAQLQIGNQQQQQAQLPLTAAYNQALQQYQSPFQQAQFAANTSNQYLWPTQTNTQTNNMTAGNTANTNTASPLSTGLGLATGAGALIGQIGGTPSSPTGVPGGPGIYPNAKRGGYFGLDGDNGVVYDSNPGYWGTTRLARGGHAKHGHDDDLYHRFMFGFNSSKMMRGGLEYAAGGYAPHGQGNYGVGSIPHMPRKGIPGDPYFSADGGMADGGNVQAFHPAGFLQTPFRSQSPLITTLDPDYAHHLMPHPGDGVMDTAGMPAFDHNPGYWGTHLAAGGYAPTVRVGRTEVSNDIRAAKERQARLEAQQAAMARPLKFRTGGYFSHV